MSWHLAIDLGASSGRHILGRVENGKLITEDVYRFDNGYVEKNGTLCWDTEKLFNEILRGLEVCKELGKEPETVSVDTWGVDYALLDKDNHLIGDVVCYRDSRTDGIQDEVHSIINETELFERIGIQSHSFNTLYQLYATKKYTPEQLEKADILLFLPDYFAFLLTGKRTCEYTIASTSEMLNLETGTWDREVLNKLGIRHDILLEPVKPCTVLGEVSKEVANKIGFCPKVVLAGSHDTASAVAAVPSLEKNTLYISSGTWSLMGIESPTPVNSEQCMKAGLTNEGGVEGRYRILKNIMGLWLIQSVRRELGKKYSFAELCDMAEQAKDMGGLLDVCDECFLAPESMIDTIKNYCAENNCTVPETPGEIARLIYHSLANEYAKSATEIEKLAGVTFGCINVIGGGSNADYLNRLTAEYSGKTVLAGPGEATAIGNLCAQLIASGELSGITQARQLIINSFEIKEYNKEGKA